MAIAVPPSFDFSYDPSLSDFAVSMHAYLLARSDIHYDHIATSAIVLDTRITSAPRILLVQRAASDSSPNMWETPGGACDADDVSILHGAARELWEEAGLRVTRFTGQVGEPHHFTSSRGKKVCQFIFAAEVSIETESPYAVKLDPEEHQKFVWATEDEVRARRVGDIDLIFKIDEVEQTVLEGFEMFSGRKT